jgi:hypothetical protein
LNEDNSRLRKIVFYPLEIVDLQSVEIPIPCDPLSVTFLDNRPVLWVRQNYEIPVDVRKKNLCIYMTGKTGVIPAGCTYLGTTSFESGLVALHWFRAGL